MKTLTAEETLVYIVEKLTANLTELQACTDNNDFIYGEKTAYVECLEWAKKWQLADENGLDFDIEQRFPL